MKTVLVIDDEACIRDLIRDLLESPDWRVLEAGAGYEGLDMARREHPDLVLVDFLMPGVSGVQVLHMLRSTPLTWDVPVILMSGLHGDESILRALAVNGTSYLMKPFTASQLLRKLGEMMKPQEQRAELPNQRPQRRRAAAAD